MRLCLLLIAAVLTLVLTTDAGTPTGGVPTSTRLQQAFPGTSEQVFQRGMRVTVFWIDARPQPSPAPDTFHGYPIRRQQVIADPRLQAQLKASVLNAIAASNGIGARCFNPHHGLRVSQGDQSVDVAVCFGCPRFVTFSGQETRSGTLAPSPKMQALFDRVLD